MGVPVFGVSVAAVRIRRAGFAASALGVQGAAGHGAAVYRQLTAADGHQSFSHPLARFGTAGDIHGLGGVSGAGRAAPSAGDRSWHGGAAAGGGVSLLDARRQDAFAGVSAAERLSHPVGSAAAGAAISFAAGARLS